MWSVRVYVCVGGRVWRGAHQSWLVLAAPPSLAPPPLPPNNTQGPAAGSGVIAVCTYGLWGAATGGWGRLASDEESGVQLAVWDTVAWVANGAWYCARDCSGGSGDGGGGGGGGAGSKWTLCSAGHSPRKCRPAAAASTTQSAAPGAGCTNAQHPPPPQAWSSSGRAWPPSTWWPAPPPTLGRQGGGGALQGRGSLGRRAGSSPPAPPWPPPPTHTPPHPHPHPNPPQPPPMAQSGWSYGAIFLNYAFMFGFRFACIAALYPLFKLAGTGGRGGLRAALEEPAGRRRRPAPPRRCRLATRVGPPPPLPLVAQP